MLSREQVEAFDLNKVNLEEIRRAQERIRQVLPTSPIKRSIFLEHRIQCKTMLKLENLNLAGSFKIRGTSNTLIQLSKEELARGIVAASAGNHAQGVAHGCLSLGAKATVFMPERTPLVKAEATRELGANVILGGRDYDEAYSAAIEYCGQGDRVFIHPFSNPHIICGQGTIGLELLNQIDNLGLIIGAVGGGGMMSGVACAIKELRPDIMVIGVQAESYSSMVKSFKQDRMVESNTGTTIADGIAVKRPSEQTRMLLNRYLDDMVAVDEVSIASAVMDLMERDHMLAEGAGAASVAGLLQLSPKVFEKIKGKTIACIISGGNIDVNLLARIIPNGLSYSGRFLRLSVRISDRPGRLAELLNLVATTGANLHEVHHDRLFNFGTYDEVEVRLDLETTSQEHQKQVTDTLTANKFRHSILKPN